MLLRVHCYEDGGGRQEMKPTVALLVKENVWLGLRFQVLKLGDDPGLASSPHIIT